eukprot:SAG31_NODE_1431_length_8376_cov_2.033829_3_plen_91_part_00
MPEPARSQHEKPGDSGQRTFAASVALFAASVALVCASVATYAPPHNVTMPRIRPSAKAPSARHPAHLRGQSVRMLRILGCQRRLMFVILP